MSIYDEVTPDAPAGYRADRFLLDRGDDPTGIDFTARPIRVAS